MNLYEQAGSGTHRRTPFAAFPCDKTNTREFLSHHIKTFWVTRHRPIKRRVIGLCEVKRLKKYDSILEPYHLVSFPVPH